MSATAPERPVAGEAVTGLILAQSARQTQLQVRQDALALIADLWPMLNLENPARTWQQWLAAMTQFLTRFHAQAAQEAALLYRGTRQLELGEPGSAVLASPPSEEWVAKALGYAAPGVYDLQRRKGAEPEQASRSALTKTLGVSSRIVLDGSRTTMIESADADIARVGWYRITDGDPCAFCALMASRGAVYRSAEAAGAGEENDWHDDCGCTVASTFLRQHELTSVAAQAQDIYQSHAAHLPNAERMPAFRKAWNSRPRTKAAQAA